jgi:hypothetical protein
MTKEQIIVIGFIAAAFLAGWIASLVTRRRARSAGDDNWLPLRYSVEAVTAPAPARAQGTGGAESPPLAEEVGQALRSDAANDGMLSVVRADQDAALSELELDLADWGFTYGVAWARAREREPAGPDDAVAAEALEAAERVFRAYTAGDDWTQRAVQDRSNGAS